jgi:hypothetical protein
MAGLTKDKLPTLAGQMSRNLLLEAFKEIS